MVVVSQTPDIMRIQDRLAQNLGASPLKATTKEGKAERLLHRLQSAKKVLIILDDVWEYLGTEDLKNMGISLVMTRTRAGKFFSLHALTKYALQWIVKRSSSENCYQRMIHGIYSKPKLIYVTKIILRTMLQRKLQKNAKACLLQLWW